MSLVQLTVRVSFALLTALLLAAAQSPISLGPLALVALAPWLWAVRGAGPGEALALGALAGTVYGCLVAPWIPEALRALGSSRATAVLGLLVTAAWAKLPLFAATGVIAQQLRGRTAAVQIAAVAAAFGAGEAWLGAWRLGVPWALLGHSQLATPGVAQLAVVGGVPLISAWVAGTGHALALAVDRVPRAPRLAAALAGAWVALALLGLPLAKAVRPAGVAGPAVTLLVVQPQLPHGERWDWRLQHRNLERVSAYTRRALSAERTGIEAVVWPENLLTAPVDADPALWEALQREVDAWGLPLIGGLARTAPSGRPQRYRSSVVWIDPGDGLRDAVDKARAVPLLESSRALLAGDALASLYGRSARWPKVEEVPVGGVLRGDFAVTPVLCYEALFPGLAGARRAADSRAILHRADDRGVSGARASRQLTDFAAFRAIEQRLPLVRVAHGGLSVVVDAFGGRVSTLPRDRFAHARVTLAPAPPPALSERVALLGLPLFAAWGVGWAAGRVPIPLPRRRGARAVATRRPLP